VQGDSVCEAPPADEEPIHVIVSVGVDVCVRVHAYVFCRVGQKHVHLGCMYGTFGREITEYTVIYGVNLNIWSRNCECLCLAWDRCSH